MEPITGHSPESGKIDSSKAKAKAKAKARSWAFLSPELLADVCSRLHDATDFVRFHAVCQRWRNAPPSQLSPVETRPRQTFLPWILSRRIMKSSLTYLGRISSELTSSIDLMESSTGVQVASANGGTAWLFTGGPEKPTLFDLVTGSVTPLPPIPDRHNYGGVVQQQLRNPRGIVYGDGTIFLYCFDDTMYHRDFTAAILRPGDTAWTTQRLYLPVSHRHACAAYHDGKVLVWVSVFFWCILTPNFGGNNVGNNYVDVNLESTWDRLEEDYYEGDQCYILESRGEFLWASVLVKHGGHDDYDIDCVTPKLAVRVHALEQEVDGSDKMRWVERDNKSLGDIVMFLGSPASFTLDATEPGMDGGCAYFVYKNFVFRYNLADDEAEPVERMSTRRGSNKARVWLRPRPLVAPIQEIRERIDIRNNKYDE